MIRVAVEVREALASGGAVVALETTLVAHGFPPGEGVEVGLESERQVRAAGAVPATVGVLDGEVRVGLTEDELTRFAPDARKVGPRDVAVAAVQRTVGATTVGGTLAVARAAGIRVLATGGIGGVHRGFPHPPDISADLGQLARTPAVVVSAGVKSLLDVPATRCRSSTERPVARPSRRVSSPRRRRRVRPMRTGSLAALGFCSAVRRTSPSRTSSRSSKTR